MHNAVIVDAIRTPTGRNGGKLKDWHPASLGAHVLQALAARNPIDPAKKNFDDFQENRLKP